MPALAAAYDTQRKDGDVIVATVAAGKTVYQGALLVWDGTGKVQPLASGAGAPANFAGVARTGAPGGGDPTQADPLVAAGQVLVERRGTFAYTDADASPFVGQVVFGIDDNDVSSVAGAVAIKVGTIVAIPVAGTVQIDINDYRV